MSVLHLLHAVVVGGLLSGAAALVEGALRGAERPARFVWLVALAGTVSAPWWGPRLSSEVVTLPAMTATALTATEAAPAMAAPSLVARVGGVLATPLPALPWLWLTLGGVGVAVVGAGLVRLERRAARWPRTRIDGEEVSVSRDFGPALVGLVHPRTVVPRWAFGLARRELELILRHERAHRTAGDGPTLALGLLTAAACPWNPVVWWQFRRLRDAVELDCDRRLLRGGVSAPAYARVLVLVRLRAAAPGGATAALVESKSSLERRLKTMRAFPWTRRKVALSGAVALGLVAVACETPAPSQVEVETEAAEAEIAFEAQEQETAAGILLRRPVGQAPDAPLIVVDGVIMREAVLADLAAYDIERIEVVKGEAAREIYGERAANGVVNITTKEGRGGEVVELREIPVAEYEAVEVPFGTFPFGTFRLHPAEEELHAEERSATFTVTEVKAEPRRGGN